MTMGLSQDKLSHMLQRKSASQPKKYISAGTIYFPAICNFGMYNLLKKGTKKTKSILEG